MIVSQLLRCDAIEFTYEEEVDTSELLTGLESDTENGTVGHTGTSEDLDKACLGKSLFLLKLLADIVDLSVDTGGVDVETSKVGNGLSGFLNLTLSVGESRRLRKEEDANTEKESPEEVEGVGDSPRSATIVVVGTPVNHLGAPDTKGDKELIAGDDETSNDGGSTLTLVHGDSDRQSADTKTCYKSTDRVLVPGVLRGDLDDGADAGPESRDGDSLAATN